MIEVKRVSKTFYGEKPVKAVNNVSIQFNDNEVFGLVGTNGAGKSTLLRMIAGVLRQDCGLIKVNGRNVYDNPQAKEQLYFVPGESYFFPNSTPMDMGIYESCIYERFDMGRYVQLLQEFDLDPQRRIAEFSKGMKRQLSILLALCANTKYILLDETFDGLDPVMRQAVKSLFAKDMADRGLTPVLSSHNLRELEDICDHVGLLHKGGILLSENINDMKVNIQKLQVVFTSEEERQKAEALLQIMDTKRTGRLYTYTVKGSREDIEAAFRGVGTVFFEILPLTLEEIFISETEVAGYDIRKIISA